MEKISLISRVRAGDRKAFDELCRKYYAMLVSYARLFLKDDWAEDVVQDVFYNVWQRRETLDDSNSLYKYLLRSVYNQSVNYVNKHRHACSYRSYYQERIESIGYAYYDPDRNPVIEKLYSQDLRTSINEAIAALPAKCREVFSLSYLQGFSHREISERMGIAQSTVENHIYLALRQLRAKLSKSELILLLFFIFLQNFSLPPAWLLFLPCRRQDFVLFFLLIVMRSGLPVPQQLLQLLRRSSPDSFRRPVPCSDVRRRHRQLFLRSL